MQSPQAMGPQQSLPPSFPSGGENPLERGQLMQTNGDPLNNYPTDQLGDRSDGMQLLAGTGSNQSGFGSGPAPDREIPWGNSWPAATANRAGLSREEDR